MNPYNAIMLLVYAGKAEPFSYSSSGDSWSDLYRLDGQEVAIGVNKG
jgi:hypothetical protein